MERSTLKEFNQIYAIMEEAFPPIERRTYEKQKELFALSHYHLYTWKDSSMIKALISIWEYDYFMFIEHLAIAAPYRNKGLGASLVKEAIAYYQKPVILEAELPKTDLAIRRIKFYERLGFIANHQFIYEQPPLQAGFQPYPLCLMSYPEKLSQQDFEEIRRKLYSDVYGIKMDSY